MALARANTQGILLQFKDGRKSLMTLTPIFHRVYLKGSGDEVQAKSPSDA
jgi:hypothetical protein